MNGKIKKMRYGIGMRTQYPQGDDMVKRTEDQLDQRAGPTSSASTA